MVSMQMISQVQTFMPSWIKPASASQDITLQDEIYVYTVYIKNISLLYFYNIVLNMVLMLVLIIKR